MTPRTENTAEKVSEILASATDALEAHPELSKWVFNAKGQLRPCVLGTPVLYLGEKMVDRDK